MERVTESKRRNTYDRKKNVPCWRCRRWKKFIRRQPVHCNMEKPYELLIAVRLSAQCTDARVNQITPKLFAAYPTLESLAAADIGDLEEIVRPCGFYHMKARSIKEMSAQLLLHFGGVVPDNMKDLLSLSGVGRKTANLILGDVYGKPAIVADTHFIRITGRLGLTKSKDPVQVGKRSPPADPAGAFLGLLSSGWCGSAEIPAVHESPGARAVPWRHSVPPEASKGEFRDSRQGKCCGMHRESA